MMESSCPGPLFDARTHLRRMACAGRLDLQSRGLLVFTQSGVVARRLVDKAAAGEAAVEKEYAVTTRQRVLQEHLGRLAGGTLVLDGAAVLPAGVERLSERSFRITLREGRNRQIRRMCGQ